MSEKHEVGIVDKASYYDQSDRAYYHRVTVFDSIHLDRRFIEKKRAAGLDPTTLKTFLLGGCHSPESIEAMAEFMVGVNPGRKMTLIVTDINEEAFNLMKQRSIETPNNIRLEMFRGDLRSLALKSNSVDYVRMDYTQNFNSLSDQRKLLGELRRILSDGGIVASVVDMWPEATSTWQKFTRLISKDKGSTIYGDRYNGYSKFLPTEEFIKGVAKKSGFDVSFIDSRPQPRNSWDTQRRLVVYQ